MNTYKTTGLTLLLCLLATVAFSQKKKGKSKCEVKKTAIAERYIGGCKKGLAHGKGKAQGEDQYVGVFRNGLPHGRGVYTYSTGEVFSGRWENGLKEGEGNFTFDHEGRDSTTHGIWKEDIYIGPVSPTPYLVKYNRGVERFRFDNLREGQRVMMKFQQNGMNNLTIQDVLVQASSGNRLDINNYTRGFENIEEFPFKCRVRYLTLNKTRSVKVEVVFDFVINEPGDWEIILNN